MDYFLAGEDQQRTNQPNDLAGGWPLSCNLACKCVCWGFNLQTCFTIYLWHTNWLSIRLEVFISPKLVLRMSSIFSRDKLWFLSYYLRANGCFLYGWCSPATWTVKLPGWRSNL